MSETLTHYEGGKAVSRKVDAGASAAVERSRMGVYKILSEQIDMRGKTKRKVLPHYVWGMVHYLDDKSLSLWEEFVRRAWKATVHLKACLEAGTNPLEVFWMSWWTALPDRRVQTPSIPPGTRLP